MTKVKVYKPLWDYMDKQEGKEEGTSFKKFKEEAKRQGYEAEDSSKGGKVSYHKHSASCKHKTNPLVFSGNIFSKEMRGRR